MVQFTSKSKAAVGYYRTSSATNVGADRDSLIRQEQAVQDYSLANGLEVVESFYDAAVSGADPVDERPAFTSMISYIQQNNVDTILVENASRFARDLVVQITGHEHLKDQAEALIPVDAPRHFTEETPTAVMVRNILGAVAQHEKAQLVAKLKAARDRKRERTGKCEGRKSYQELDPLMVHQAKRLYRRSPKTGKRRSLRQVSKELEQMGFVTASGKAFGAEQVKRLVS